MSDAVTSGLLSIANKKNDSCFPSLSFKTRLYGFLGCFLAGLFLDIMSFLTTLLGQKNAAKFAIIYTLGNILALTGTTFLVGPKQQFKNMTNKTRIGTSIVYISALIGTLVAALIKPPIKPLILVLILVQFLALTWYSLSFIPYARTLVKKCFQKAITEDKA